MILTFHLEKKLPLTCKLLVMFLCNFTWYCVLLGYVSLVTVGIFDLEL